MSYLIESLNEQSGKHEFDMDAKLGLDHLSEEELLTSLNSNYQFIQQNFRECIDIFGAKVTGDLLEECQVSFQMIAEGGKWIENIEDWFKNNFDPKQTADPSIKGRRPGNIYDGFEKPESFVDKIKHGMENNAKPIAGAVLAALIITGASMVYKNYFSKAAKACKGKKGDEKSACMLDYEENALRMKAKVLNKSMAFANKTKDSNTFKKKIKKSIDDVMKRISKLK